MFPFSGAARRRRATNHRSSTELALEVLAQPTDEQCGTTCLHTLPIGFSETPLPLHEVIDGVTTLGSGGTLAAYLGLHALGRGYSATLYTYDFRLFDPTWFSAPGRELGEALALQGAGRESTLMHTST
jgi:hypothetical protein